MQIIGATTLPFHGRTQKEGSKGLKSSEILKIICVTQWQKIDLASCANS
jgi:hypothetical protein